MRLLRNKLVCAVLLVFVLLVVVLLVFKTSSPVAKCLQRLAFSEDIDFTQADNETGFPNMIVPNIIHLIHFGVPELNFGEVITIKSAYVNHRPDRIMIHCDNTSMSGEYWDLVKDIPVIEVVFLKKPETIFGKNITWIEHASDVARIRVLMEYGGIYLDTDVYVVSSLNRYRKFEYTCGLDQKEYIGSQVVIAHKDARFLKLYYETYRYYRGDLWLFNSGELPTTSILYGLPHLVHKVPELFGVHPKIATMLYGEKSNKWRDFVTIHLLLRHVDFFVKDSPVKEFDMTNIRTYNRTFGDMAREILFGTTDIV